MIVRNIGFTESLQNLDWIEAEKSQTGLQKELQLVKKIRDATASVRKAVPSIGRDLKNIPNIIIKKDPKALRILIDKLQKLEDSAKDDDTKKAIDDLNTQLRTYEGTIDDSSPSDIHP